MSQSRPVPSFLIPFVKLHEGFVARAEPDPVGLATIGYGHRIGTDDPLRGQTLDEPGASALLARDLDEEACFFCAFTPELLLGSLSNGQYAALIDFVFNEGIGAYRTSALRLRVESREWSYVPLELSRWRYAGGRVLPGLVSRRNGEAAMWLGHYPPQGAAS
jgi:lysozyme